MHTSTHMHKLEEREGGGGEGQRGRQTDLQANRRTSRQKDRNRVTET